MSRKAENKLTVQEKLANKYSDAIIGFELNESQELDEGKFLKIQNLLNRVGVNLDKSGNTIAISVDPIKYGKINREFAGIDKTVAIKLSDNTSEERPYYYQDIILMRIAGKKHDEIMKELEMSRATYFRHYQEMKKSEWFQTLDQSQLNNEEYLWNHKPNYIF